eukprot:gene56208-42492_t
MLPTIDGVHIYKLPTVERHAYSSVPIWVLRAVCAARDTPLPRLLTLHGDDGEGTA